MNGLIYGIFYDLPLYRIVQLMILLIFAGIFLERFFVLKNNKNILWQMGNGFIFAGMLVVILVLTISSSREGSEVVLMPFHLFVEARVQPEMYRSMLMNIFLFFPLGLTLPYALPKKMET